VNDCLPSIHACTIRVARLEADGVPLPGANNLYVSDAITELTFTPEVRAGQEVEVPDGCGGLCVSYKADDVEKWWNVELTICRPDPQLTELLAGGTVLTSGDAVGYQPGSLNTVRTGYGVSIEVWSHRLDDGGDIDDVFPYWHWAFPKVKGLRLGARRLFEGALENPFTAGKATENAHWFDGPGNDWEVDSSKAWGVMPSASTPTAACGYQTLAAS
jgi:hypothetical protein